VFDDQGREMKAQPGFFLPPSAPIVFWNPSDKNAEISLSNNNLTATKTTSNSLKSVRANASIPHTGSMYFEVLAVSVTVSTFALVGVGTGSASLASFVGNDANGWGYYEDTGQKYTNNVASSYGSSWPTDGTVIGVAFKNGSVWFAKNNVWQNSGDPAANTGAAFTGITGTIYPMLSLYRGASSPVHVMTGRFRVSDLSYSPPSGFGLLE
jgi:hypothetical protein